MDKLFYTLGIDAGIASIGWAVLENDNDGEPKRIVALGSHVFEKAENQKTGASLALPRREARGARRVIRRRRHRKERIKYLIETSGLMSRSDIDILCACGSKLQDIYEIRVEALDCCLNKDKFVRLLIHLAQRRGYKSNSKSEEAKDAKESGKVKSAIIENQKYMKEKGYRTVGEMYLKDDRFTVHNPDGSIVHIIHNKPEEYRVTVERGMLEAEIKLIFEKQREFGNVWASCAFEKQYMEIWSSQRNFDEGPGGNSPYGGNMIEKMLGYCTFEKGEHRAPKASYSAEYFRLLQWINSIRLVEPGKDDVFLTEDQRKELIQYIIGTAEVTYAGIRKRLDIDKNKRFNMLTYASNEVEKVEKAKPAHMQFWHKLRKTLKLKEPCKELSQVQMDDIAEVLFRYKNDDKRRCELVKKGIPEKYIEDILELSATKAGHLSYVAMHKLIPYLESGMRYDEACEQVYGRHDGKSNSAKPVSKLNISMIDVPNNPVVKRAVSRAIKVINAIVARYGAPEMVRVELARELGKDFMMRGKIDKQYRENAMKNEAIKKQVAEYKHGDLVTGQDIIKFKLFQEQNGVCLYSGQSLDMSRLFEAGYVDIDHIIPYSMCFDDSFTNKVLVLSAENRQKSNRTPYEYMGSDPERWNRFTTLVGSQIANFKKRQKLLTIPTEQKSKEWKARNLSDTQYLSRLIYNLINDNLLLEDRGKCKQKVQVVNGAITGYIRKRIGLEKIREDGDLHHAMDAAVIACITPGMVAKITRHSQRMERYRMGGEYIDYETGELLSREEFDARYAPAFPQPWPRFRDELEARLSPNPAKEFEIRKLYLDAAEQPEPVFVSRMPNHKVKGAAHKDTIQRYEKGQLVCKVPLSSLNLDKNGEIAGYYRPQDDILLYEALKARLAEHGGKGKDAFPEGTEFHKPKHDGTAGPLVTKVKIAGANTLPVRISRGAAENESMIRVDVYRVEGDGYYLVPVYVTDTVKAELPNRASIAHKPYEEWKVMNEKDFLFSLYIGDLIRIKSKKDIVLQNKAQTSQLVGRDLFVYYGGTDIANGAISITSHDRKYHKDTLGFKTLMSVEKYEVDVLGSRRRAAQPEKRQGFEQYGIQKRNHH